MPNRREHLIVGTALGAGYAAYRATQSPNGHAVIELIGGGLGGAGGGVAPDVLEPALGGQHRRTAHSFVAGGLLVRTAEALNGCAENLRTCAAELEREASQLAPDDDCRVFLLLRAYACWVLAGMINGLLAGYVSHLALDFCTPAGLPIA